MKEHNSYFPVRLKVCQYRRKCSIVMSIEGFYNYVYSTEFAQSRSAIGQLSQL